MGNSIYEQFFGHGHGRGDHGITINFMGEAGPPHARFGHEFGGRGGRRGGRGFGGGRERLFDSGDIKLVILMLLGEQPSYGYQLIRTMEERLAGGYTPSAGVIYPTLTLLEEEGLAIANTQDNKKVFSLTPEGTEYLQTQQDRLKEITERLENAGKTFERHRSPELMRAFGNLRGAVAARLSREGISEERLKKMAEAIDAAAKAIDEL